MAVICIKTPTNYVVWYKSTDPVKHLMRTLVVFSQIPAAPCFNQTENTVGAHQHQDVYKA